MNFLTAGLNKLKAKSLYRERGFDFDLESATVDEINQKALSVLEQDILLGFDYLLFNYYYTPCAYTASNLLAGYIALMKVDKELEEGVPPFDFFQSVEKYLTKASRYEDVFDAKEYFITLAQFYLIESIDNIDKAFTLLNRVPTSYIDKDVQYLTGMLYFLLGMKDVAVKLLESAMESDNIEIKASASLIIAKIGDISQEKKVELLEKAITASKPAIITESIAQLELLGREDVVAKVDFDKLEKVMTPDLLLSISKSFIKTDNQKGIESVEKFIQDEPLYSAIYDKVKSGEDVDVDAIRIELNQKKIDEIADSELYKTADSVTRRMLNNEIMETVMEEDEFSENDYIVFIDSYVK